MIPPNRIERAARALGPTGLSEERARQWAAEILAAAYPELASGSHWVAPMEATEGMIRHLCVHPDMGPGGMVIRYSVDKVPKAWREAQAAYLSQPDKDKTA